MQEDQNMTKTTASAQAMDGLTKTFYITGPDGTAAIFVRVSAEFSGIAENLVITELQDILQDAEEHIGQLLRRRS